MEMDAMETSYRPSLGELLQFRGMRISEQKGLTFLGILSNMAENSH
jgi:hypothetical protein